MHCNRVQSHYIVRLLPILRQLTTLHQPLSLLLEYRTLQMAYVDDVDKF